MTDEGERGPTAPDVERWIAATGAAHRQRQHPRRRLRAGAAATRSRPRRRATGSASVKRPRTEGHGSLLSDVLSIARHDQPRAGRAEPQPEGARAARRPARASVRRRSTHGCDLHRLLRARRAAWSRHLAVPTGTPRVRAISTTGRSSTWWRTRISRSGSTEGDRTPVRWRPRRAPGRTRVEATDGTGFSRPSRTIGRYG